MRPTPKVPLLCRDVAFRNAIDDVICRRPSSSHPRWIPLLLRAVWRDSGHGTRHRVSEQVSRQVWRAGMLSYSSQSKRHCFDSNVNRSWLVCWEFMIDTQRAASNARRSARRRQRPKTSSKNTSLSTGPGLSMSSVALSEVFRESDELVGKSSVDTRRRWGVICTQEHNGNLDIMFGLLLPPIK